MTDLPERIWAGKYHTTWWQSRPHHQMTQYIRADTAIPRADLDAMVAAAYEDAAERAGRESALIYESEVRPDADNNVYRTVCEVVLSALPANARAALDTIVREAVEAERERCARIADSLCDKWWYEYKNPSHPNRGSSHCEGKSDGAADIAAAIREEPAKEHTDD